MGEGAYVIGATIRDTAAPGGQDDNGHGTHVAGTAGSVDDSKGIVGVSPDVTLHPVKALTAAGVGFVSDVAKGIEHTADRNWDVANLSVGGPETDILREACKDAYNQGVLLVAAAGNSGPCGDCVTYPAAYEPVVAVSATTRDDSLGSFSSTGPEVELAAPRENILSTFLSNTYTSISGTSMACPHVAGAGAQLMANGYDNDDARRRLQSTAENIGLSKNEQGNGLVDVAAALGYDSGDDLDEGVNGGSTPSASIDGVTESETSSPHAEFEVSWSASDDDGDLASAELVLIDDTDGGQEDSESVNIDGASTSDTATLQAKHDDPSGNDYLVSLSVRDEAGNAGSDSDTVTKNNE